MTGVRKVAVWHDPGCWCCNVEPDPAMVAYVERSFRAALAAFEDDAASLRRTLRRDERVLTEFIGRALDEEIERARVLRDLVPVVRAAAGPPKPFQAPYPRLCTSGVPWEAWRLGEPITSD